MLAIGCSGDAAPSPSALAQPGEANVVLSSATGTEGALLLAITGPVTRVLPVGYETASRSTSTGASIVLRGDIASGVVVRVQVPDLRNLGEYSVRVDAASDRQTYQELPVGSYTAILVKR